jgi:hypothetical protein
MTWPRWALMWMLAIAIYMACKWLTWRSARVRTAPMFFAIQGVAVIVERSEAGRRIGLGGGSRGRLFAMVTLLAPVGFLFHRPFVVGIIVPFMRVLGAI